ncbi:peptidylprolyl isomerase [Leptothermofonsia sp. ETS-13]|uniref:peptidylprolyl isomerase n=1 Tax=Leptothermofonsia sp. ETS-13 TaxID=3035696 RepID=UPI003BA23E69
MTRLIEPYQIRDRMISFSGIDVDPEEIIYFLRKSISLRDICQKIFYQRVIEQAAQERGVVVTADAIQAEADCLRRQKRLERASDTLAWLDEQMITAEDWEAGIRDRLLAQALAERIFGNEVERYFAENRLDFEQIVLYRIVVPYEPVAQELFYQIEENEISFYEVAHLYDIDPQRRLMCGYEGRFHRWGLKPEIAAVVFGARIGQVLGPFASEQGYELLRVEEFIEARLTPEIHQQIVGQLFKEWLENELNFLINSQSSESDL